ncbi:DUF3231 family protein [Priestia megaterium]|jgi:hypothetical protein|uniref:DUF3231 family protein n=1 Tax=Priestia megaterium TaxID=1404 RepID=UPI001BE7CFAD|nr:DUF3231 family protein [Priestia megaterium]MBT2259340.1 DUF3231 family protein [Priestia megaterium]MBT2280029.1 DUF3231 family protein [Priestia megaterium]MBU8690947.1 DUF3231 family protein [Priestia megaterium]
MNENIKSEMQKHQQNQRLNAAELGYLWAQYLGDTLYVCVLGYFLSVVKDAEIKELLKKAHQISQTHVDELTELFSSEKIPIPVGFGEQDVNKGVPALFDDIFMAIYVNEMAIGGMKKYARALSAVRRQDIYDHLSRCVKESDSLLEDSNHVILRKSMLMRPPVIPYPVKVNFVDQKTFISPFFSQMHPLTSLEVTAIQEIVNTNVLGKTLMLAFSQVATTQKLRSYFFDGVKLASKQIKQFTELLSEADLPSPRLLDAYVTNSTISPFSDKLMMYHTSTAVTIAIDNCGAGLSMSFRSDVAVEFSQLIGRIGKYGKDGIRIMIEQGWMEEPPMATDRKKLAEK